MEAEAALQEQLKQAHSNLSWSESKLKNCVLERFMC
jgi:hypothetical protein